MLYEDNNDDNEMLSHLQDTTCNRIVVPQSGLLEVERVVVVAVEQYNKL